jgi:ketosteroid isomerase-like protein
MSERDDFLDWIGTRLKEAEIAIHNGDASPRFAIWSTNEPQTLLGAWMSATGHADISEIFHKLEGTFSDCTSYTFEMLAADVSGDLAYTVGYEHTEASVDGEPGKYTLRATQVYRRENGEWKVVHRHADPVPQGRP